MNTRAVVAPLFCINLGSIKCWLCNIEVWACPCLGVALPGCVWPVTLPPCWGAWKWEKLLESRSCILPSSTGHPAPVVFCFQLVSFLSPKLNIWPLPLHFPQLELTPDPYFVMLRAIPNLKEQGVQHAKKITSGKLSKATGLFSQSCTARGEEAAFFQVLLLAEFQALLAPELACLLVSNC